MTGELWRSAFQIGKENSYGSDAAATRKMYFDIGESKLTQERDPRTWRFASGRRANVGAITLGPKRAGGMVSMPLSAAEIVELALISLQGGVSPAGAGTAKLWTFVPGNTAPDSATMEWNDGARDWQETGVYGNVFRIAGSAAGENKVSVDLFGKVLSAAAATEGLADGLPDFLEGWETKLYIDALGGTAGTTAVSDTLINWDVSHDNQLGRKKWANNTDYYDANTLGEAAARAQLLFEAAPAAALTEFDNYNGVVERLVRLEFGQNAVIDGSDKTFVTVDIPGAWTVVDLGQTDEGTRAYQMTIDYIYDVANTMGFRLRAQNARATAFGNRS